MILRPTISIVFQMAPTPRLSISGVVGGAIMLVDTEGFDALTVSAVAQHLSVGPSALYTYCDGLDGLRNLVAVAATENLTRGLRDAAIGTSGGHALEAMGASYRGFALGHPGQFAATLRPPSAGDADLAAANMSLLDVFILVYTAMGLDTDGSRLAARSTQSAIHGFLALEYVTGTSDTHQAEYRHLIEMLQRGLAPRSP